MSLSKSMPLLHGFNQICCQHIAWHSRRCGFINRKYINNEIANLLNKSKIINISKSSYVTDSGTFDSNDDKKKQEGNKKQKGNKKQFAVPKIITTDRIILLGLGVLVVGSLVGWEANNKQQRKHSAMIKRLHSVVLSAQNAVKEEEYEEALKNYREARQLVEQVKMSSQSVQNKVILNIVDQLGHLAYELGNWLEAEQFLSETERIMLDCGITKDDDVYIEVILRLAKIDAINNRPTQAMERFQYCVSSLENKISVKDIYEEECSERLTLYGMTLTEYATFAREIGLLDVSEAAFSKALNICRHVLGPNHEQTSVLANDLATVYDEKGRYNKAIRLAEKAIKIASETAPENLATYKYNLAHILMHKGDFGRARKALREALQLAEENDDPDTKELAESSIMKLDINN